MLFCSKMVDQEYSVRRYITEFSEETDQLLAEYELSSFDLSKFQNEFGVADSGSPMFDCYQIGKGNVSFLNEYLAEEPKWDFEKKSYFVESHAI